MPIIKYSSGSGKNSDLVREIILHVLNQVPNCEYESGVEVQLQGFMMSCS
jgi:hypothetical protein